MTCKAFDTIVKKWFKEFQKVNFESALLNIQDTCVIDIINPEDRPKPPVFENDLEMTSESKDIKNLREYAHKMSILSKKMVRNMNKLLFKNPNWKPLRDAWLVGYDTEIGVPIKPTRIGKGKYFFGRIKSFFWTNQNCSLNKLQS